MRRVLAGLIAFLMFLAPAVAVADWPDQVKVIRNSIVQLTMGTHSCTAFSINMQKALYVTAAHCLRQGTPLMDDEATTVVVDDPETDLSILRGLQHRKALKLATKAVQPGESVGALGYAYGWPMPTLIQGNIAAVTFIPQLEGDFIVVGNAFVGGMSGGPIFNWKGEVVSIVQRGDPSDNLGIGVVTPVLEAITRDYRER